MKKISMMMAAVAAVVMSACGSSAPKAELKTDVDSISYIVGYQQGEGIKSMVFGEQGMKLDSAYMDELIKGIIDGANVGGSDKEKAYYAGVAFGQQFATQVPKGLGQQIYGAYADSSTVANLNDFVAAVVASLKGDSTAAIKVDGDVFEYLQNKSNELQGKFAEKKYGEYKKQNEDFMKKIAKEPGVQALEDGVYYKVETEGKGQKPKASDRVKVHYEGKTIDGNVFDSSYKQGEAVEFVANQVVKGWTNALVNMPVGSKWTVYIPAEAGYGSADRGSIKPFSTMIFTIELLEIVGGDK